MNFYFTFGSIHKHPVTGEDMKDYYIRIVADNRRNARKIMFVHYSDKWAFCYNEKTFKPEFYPKGLYERYESK